MPTLRAPRALLPPLLLAALLAAPASTRAAHFLDEGSGCYACHTLHEPDSDPDTSLIAMVSRTLPLMRSASGGRTPERFGCTYCHSAPGNAAMRDALGHFGVAVSKHPVGVNFATHAETSGEYLSALGSATPDETDCVDCHDPALLAPDAGEEGGSYVDHAPPDDPRRAGNPLMLRLVSSPGRYDDLCRSCHGAAAPPFKGHDVRLVSHADAAAAPIREADGTPLRTTDAGGGAQCTACHDTHTSGEVKLLNDGHEGDTPIVGGDCTTVCHYAGDAAGSYLTRGHGRAESTYRYRGGKVDYGPRSNALTMGMACTGCHDALDTSDPSPRRRPHVERPAAGTVQQRYRARFKLSLPVQEWDTGSAFGSPLVGICSSCHAAIAPHTSRGGAAAGCTDCHDPHAERSGKGNVFMLPVISRRNGSYVPPARPRRGTKAVIYGAPRLDPATGEPRDGAADFYRGADAGGVCDNAECHPSYAPLDDFMGGRDHPGGRQRAGTDCGKCHAHGDPGGSWHAPPPQ